MPAPAAPPGQGPHAAVHGALDDLGVPWRAVADGEWGVRVPAAGRDLDIGLRLAGGYLCAQAEATWPGVADAGVLLHRHRLAPVVRYGTTRAGAVWVHAEIPEEAVSPQRVDELLGRLVEAAELVRAGERRGERSGS